MNDHHTETQHAADPGTLNHGLLYPCQSQRMKTLPANIHRQLCTPSQPAYVQCNHPDVVAINFWAANVQYLLCSVYIPPQSTEIKSDHIALDEIQTTI
jgi:hypothetical protein